MTIFNGGVKTGSRLLAFLLLPIALVVSMTTLPASSAPTPDPDSNTIQAIAWLDFDADGVNDPGEPRADHFAQWSLFNSDGSPWSWSPSPFPMNQWTGSPITPFNMKVTLGAGVSLGPAGPDQDATLNGSDIEVNGIVPGQVFQVGLTPTWKVDLGKYGGGVLDGQAPFATDPDTVCPGNPQPGDDCADNNGIVRGGNTVGYRWAVTASKTNPADPSNLSRVYLVQNVVPEAGVKLNTGSLPTSCENGDSILEKRSDGSIRLICSLGSWTESGTTKLFRWNMRVQGGTHNKDFTSTAYVTAADSVWSITNPEDPTNPVPTSAKVAPSESIVDTTKISSGFKFDLEKHQVNSWPSFQTINGERLHGVTMLYLIGLSSPLQSNSTPSTDFTFTDDLFFSADGDQSAASPVGDIEHYLLRCDLNGYWSTVLPYGAQFGVPDRGVVSSGSCQANRSGGNTSPYAVTLKDIELGGPYPTKMADGSGDLTNGPYYSATYAINVFIPDRAIQSLDDPIGNPGSDSTWVHNRITDFDPISEDGQLNYGGNKEPGWCDGSVDPYLDFSDPGCTPMSGGGASNNLASGLATFQPLSRYSPYSSKTFVTARTRTMFPGSSNWHDGQGRITSNQGAFSSLSMAVGDSYGWKNYGVCDVWDNSTMKLVPGDHLDSSLPYATYARNTYTGGDQITSGNQPTWKYLYGHYDTTGVDPLNNPALASTTINNPAWPTTNTFSTDDGRYWGDWAPLRDAVTNCRTTPPADGWFEDPDLVPGGVDEVNAVKIIPTDPSPITTENQYAYFSFEIPLQARETFHGGPYAEQAIPVDTIIPNYSSTWGQQADTDQWVETNNGYSPAPLNYYSDGDRVTLNKGTFDLQVKQVKVQENGDSYEFNGNVRAGHQFVWEIQPSLTWGDNGAPNMVVTQTLPLGVQYNSICSTSNQDPNPDIWTTATNPSVSIDFLGRTVLTWNLGDRPAGDQTDPRLRVCVDTDPLAIDQTPLPTSSTVSADGIGPATATNTVILDQPNELGVGKYVSRPTSLDQQYTLSIKNFSDSTDFVAPKFIEVFPYNGDNNRPDGINRGIGSEYSGDLELTSEPTAVWSDDPGQPTAPGELSYSADPPETISQNWSQNTSTWCTKSGSSFTRVAGSGVCPSALSDVTAIRFDGSDPLLNRQQLGGERSKLSISFTLLMSGFAAGDRYLDKFTVSTPSIVKQSGDLLTLESNTTSTHTPGFTVGNLVFLDVNADGRYSSATDSPISGVDVEVWSAGGDDSIGGSDDYLVGTATTNSNGAWKLTRVPPGSIYARIPASEFATDGPLQGAAPSPTGDPMEDDQESQDGISDGSGAVITDIHPLSYTTDAQGVTTGTGPLGERLHGLIMDAADDFTDLTIDFGFTGTSGLTGTVWNDKNLDGSATADEPGIAWDRILVESLDGNDNLLTRFVTRSTGDGTWTLSNLLPGRYRITLGSFGGDAIPSNLTPTYDIDGADTPHAAIVNLGSGETRSQLDFGLARSFTLSGNIFKDTDNDGVHQWGEPIKSGVRVNLRRPDGTLVKSTTSDSGGSYQLSGIPVGSYYAEIPASEFEAGGLMASMSPTTVPGNEPWYYQDENVGSLQPDGSSQSPLRVFDSLILGDGNTSDSVPSWMTSSFGFQVQNPASASGRVWEDLNQDGVQDAGEPGVANAQVYIFRPVFDADSNSWSYTDQQWINADADGNWSLTGLEAGEYGVSAWTTDGRSLFISWAFAQPGPSGAYTFSLAGGEDRTGLDLGMDSYGSASGRIWGDLNRDGVQDPGEGPLEGVWVHVCINNQGPNQGGCWGTTSDNTGHWEINGIPRGPYLVNVEENSLPNGFIAPTYDVDGVTTPNEASVQVPSGGRTDIDFGYAQAVSVGDRIWYDANHDGMDELEPGIEGVTVQLRRASDDSVVDETETDKDGHYRLRSIDPGDYYVYILASQFTVGGKLHLLQVTTNSVTDPSDAVDLDNNAYPGDGSVRTGNLSLTMDPSIFGDLWNYTVDLGFWAAPDDVKPRVKIEKFTQGQDVDSAPGIPVKPGTPVKWTYKFTNIGDLPMDVADFFDDKVGPLQDPETNDYNYDFEDISAVNGENNEWSPGESVIISATGVATVGPYDNTASFTAYGPYTTDATGTATASDMSYYTGVAPGVQVETRLNGDLVADPANGPEVDADSDLQWTFKVTNSGNYPGVFTVTNSMVPSGQIKCDLSGNNEVALRVDESDTCRATTVAEEGVHQMTTTATEDGIATYDVTGTLQPGDPVTAADASGYVGRRPTPAPRITVKTLINGSGGNGVHVQPGSTMTVTHTVTNTGNTALSGVALTNNGKAVTCPKQRLAAGESMVCTEQVPAPTDSTYVSHSQVQGTPSTRGGDALAGVSTVTASDQASAITGDPPLRVPEPTQPNNKWLGHRLPDTGGPAGFLLIVSGGLMGLGALVLVVRRRRRQVGG